MIVGDFNICEPEDGRFSVWNQTFTEGDAGKTALFRIGIAQPNFYKEDTAADSTLRTLSRIDRAFINVPWRKHEIFTATPM